MTTTDWQQQINTHKFTYRQTQMLDLKNDHMFLVSISQSTLDGIRLKRKQIMKNKEIKKKNLLRFKKK